MTYLKTALITTFSALALFAVDAHAENEPKDDTAIVELKTKAPMNKDRFVPIKAPNGDIFTTVIFP